MWFGTGDTPTSSPCMCSGSETRRRSFGSSPTSIGAWAPGIGQIKGIRMAALLFRTSVEVVLRPRVCVSGTAEFHGVEYWWFYSSQLGRGFFQGCAGKYDLLEFTRRRRLSIFDVQQVWNVAFHLHRRSGSYWCGDNRQVGEQREEACQRPELVQMYS